MPLKRISLSSSVAVILGLVACGAPPSFLGSADGRSKKGEDPVDVGKLPDGTSTADLLPARIRRLTNAEYNASVQALLETTQAPAESFPPDTRQHGYTVNEAQRVDPLLSRQLDLAGTALADEAVGRLDELAPCDDPESGGRACAERFIDTFVPRAYRRPLSDQERAGLLALYRAGSTDATYAEGIHLIVRGVLQSPNFLYVTELGDGSAEGTIPLTGFEMASAMAYLLTSGPPDKTLSAAAESGELSTPEGRVTHARRLLESDAGREGVIRFVREWLALDRISTTDKDSNVYPDYSSLQASMDQETRSFVGASLDSSGASVEELLGAPWTVASADLAAFYGASGQGRVDVPDRPGLLNRAAFLSVHAHANETAPVLRGTAVLRRVNCVEIEIPTTLDVDIVPPVANETLTTRERFSIHSRDSACTGCHDLIDPLGFSFEHFDGMGARRATENGKPVDSSADVTVGFDFDGAYMGSDGLAARLATSDSVRDCVARQLFRATIAESDGAPSTEGAFLNVWSELSETDQKSLVETLVALMGSDLIAYRSEP